MHYVGCPFHRIVKGCEQSHFLPTPPPPHCHSTLPCFHTQFIFFGPWFFIQLLGTPLAVRRFVAQTGDIATGTGAGGESIWGKKFKDDKDGLKTKLDKRGLVGMCNNGKNSNTSQFFFGLAPLPKLTGKHVVFGEIVEGMDVVDAIEAAGTEDTEGKPTVPVIIVGSGVLE